MITQPILYVLSFPDGSVFKPGYIRNAGGANIASNAVVNREGFCYCVLYKIFPRIFELGTQVSGANNYPSTTFNGGIHDA